MSEVITIHRKHAHSAASLNSKAEWAGIVGVSSEVSFCVIRRDVIKIL